MKGGQIDHSHPQKNYIHPSLIRVKNIKSRTDLFRTHLLKDQLDVFARVVGKDAVIICKN